MQPPTEKTAPFRGFIRRFVDKYFSPRLDLRVRLFHILAMGGSVISGVMSAFAILNGSGAITSP